MASFFSVGAVIGTAPRQDLSLIVPADQRPFRVGRTVEVESYERGYVGSWYSAVILGFAENDQYLVDYKTLTECTELVDGFRIRPLPPPGRRDSAGYTLLDQVDARYRGGWWIGQICRVGVDRQTQERVYSVYFWTSNEVLHGFPDRKLRPRQECIGRHWTATPKGIARWNQRARLGELVTALQPAGAGSSRSFTYPTGDEKIVEVRSDVEAFRGTWFPALVAQRNKKNGRYILQTVSFASEDGTHLDWVVADPQCMRPSPPPFEMTGPFKEGEPVEAWVHGGWFQGEVKRVLGEARYMVQLVHGETLEFRFLQLRPHQVWTASGDWISYSEGRVVDVEEA